jgi:hypothetical protein
MGLQTPAWQPATPRPDAGTSVPADPPPPSKLRRLRDHNGRYRRQAPPRRAWVLIPAALGVHLLPWPPMFIRILLLLAAGGVLGWRIRITRQHWDQRLYADAAVTAGTLWMLYAVRCGLWGPAGRFSLLAFLLLWSPLAWLWWDKHRPHHAKAAPATPVDDIDVFRIRWEAAVQPEFDWAISDPQQVASGTAYRLALVPGQTIEDAANARRKIASLLRMSRTRITFEHWPSTIAGLGTDDESVLRMLILDADNPQHHTQEWTGPTLDKTTGIYKHGVYPDGDAFVRLFDVEDGHPHRARNGLWCGATGKGKSRGVAVKIAEQLLSGMFVVWYADGQAGASAPELDGAVDWYADSREETVRMLKAAWKVMKARSKAMKQMMQAAFRGEKVIYLGSPAFPLLQIILDEVQEFLTDKIVAKLVKGLLRMGNKVGIGVDLITQVPLLSELGAQSGDTGAEVTRAMAKAGNMAIYKAEEGFTGRVTLGHGVEVDPRLLPDVPGACHINDGRTVWCRTLYITMSKLAAALDGTATLTLEDASARAAGSDYASRHQRAADNQTPADQIDLDDLDAELAVLLGERMPGQPAPGTAAKSLTIKQAVFEAVKAHGGPMKRDEVDQALAAMGVTASKSSVDQTLAWWVDRGHLDRPSHGHYDLVTREAPANA